MIKITALNESESEAENEDESQVTKEAEETIAISEYVRALSFKSENKNDDALILFNELLETRVLNEISFEDKEDKLFCIRYNCHKNIALIHEENDKEQLALEHYIKAMELDNTDVYTMFRLGKLSLKLEQWELAQIALHKCLARNPNHWPSADGILQCLCKTANIMGAYGWALKWYTKDENYTRAEDVLIEITENFSDIIPFFESVWKTPFSRKSPKSDIRKKSVFPEPNPEMIEFDTKIKKPNLDNFHVDNLNWLSIGKYIVSVYNHLIETKQSIVFLLNLNDIYQDKIDSIENKQENEIEIVPKLELNEDSEMTEILTPEISSDIKENLELIDVKLINPAIVELLSDSNAEDSDNSKIELSEVIRKPRRRCSDLSFLEQWGWHKNRRYSSRKKSQQDRSEIDNSLNAFLKRIFAKYFEENYENQSPFVKDIKSDVTEIKKVEENSTTIQNFKDFQRKTETNFQEFLKDLKSENFDLILLIYKWLKYVSQYWNQLITDEMKTLYHQIYKFYLNHFDFATWNQLSNNAFNASFRMALFYLELDHDETIEKFKSGNHEIDPQWKMIFHHLMFNTGVAFVIEDDNYKNNIKRLIWQDYCSSKLENDLYRSVECLQHIEYLIENEENNEKYQLNLPNLKNNIIELNEIRKTRINLQRKISLNNVKNLYDNHNYKELVKILKESFVNSTDIKNSDNTIMKIQTQIEVLLESIWNIEKYDECFIWSEKCLNFAVNNLLLAPADTYRYEEWAASVNFILIYIEELVLKDYEIFISLEKHISRLVQSLVKILTHQLDSPFDKNNNPTHMVNIKQPWVILHQLLQRTEDNSPVMIKTKPTNLTQTDIEENIEELLPHTFLLLFTAHEYLGKRQWCTRDNGQLLLYTLEVIIPKFRAPYMDACKDLVGEYLEQITYCLYGYPPKKARSRHIEEHDATSVDLIWKRALQLFELYRPENLPEFNSYKLESITADMEQLLLKIVPLIPKDIDPSLQSSAIRDFISGTTTVLPNGFSLLPQKISCIYYLLADYYFKSRDFQRTIKYYVLDLTCEPNRFDSWAGIALAKASKLETKFNSCILLDYKQCLNECENALRCFEECIKINRNHTLLWIEYGSFAYTIHSYCSRYLKHTQNLSMEQFAFVETRKEKYLKIASDCFIVADKTMKIRHDTTTVVIADNDDDDSHDEKWLHHFMLGKIAEKQKEHPKLYLDHYLLAANLLFENNAIYPIKINHNNPQTLSIEALEIFYRTSSSIIKYLELHTEVNREIGRFFLKVLKDLASSPFSLNQAKIDDSSINALKRKLAVEKQSTNKEPKLDNVENISSGITYNSPLTENPVMSEIPNEKVDSLPEAQSENVIQNSNIDKINVEEKPSSQSRPQTPNIITDLKKDNTLSRRGSQESSATTTTTTGTGGTSSTSSTSSSDSSSSDSSSSDSESGNSTSDEDCDKTDENTPFSQSELEVIYQKCVKNLEECATRFPEHYKSIYRLIYHYLNAPDKLKNLEKCRQLLLGNYTTTLGNQIVGLFAERKNNNFFNGIWRIPSSEIDRPGSFESHLVKCVHILLEVLRKSEDHKMLIDLALQLHRTPDNDKRYIKDSERIDLYKQAITYCAQIMRDILKRNNNKRNDEEVLILIIDIYKAYKKCIKHLNHKEAIFTQILIDAYKFYIQDKVGKMPENVNLLDLAIKLCTQEISLKKNMEKQQQQGITQNTHSAVPGLEGLLARNIVPNKSDNILSSSGVTSSSNLNVKPPIQIPGISNRPRGRPVGSKNAPNSLANMNANYNAVMGMMDPASMATLIALYNNPAMGPHLSKDPKYVNNFFNEYYKFLGTPSAAAAATAAAGVSPPIIPASLQQNLNTIDSISQLSQSNITQQLSSLSPSKIPQFDIKNLIASAASQVAAQTTAQSSSTTISIGSGQLTITPTSSKPSSIPTSLKDNNSGRSNSPKIHTNTKTGSSSVSVTKVPTNSPGSNSSGGGISVKPLSDLTEPSLQQSSAGISSNFSGLPKSLTITPTGSPSGEKIQKNIYSGNKQTNQIYQPEHCKQIINTGGGGGKIKNTKKSSFSHPYASSNTTTLTAQSNINKSVDVDNLFALAAAGQQSLSASGANFNLPTYSQQASLIKSYADMLGTVGMSSNVQLLAQIAKFPLPPTAAQQRRPYQKRSRTPKSNIPTTSPVLNAPSLLGQQSQSNIYTKSSTKLQVQSTFGQSQQQQQQQQQQFISKSKSNIPSPLLTHSPTSLQISPTKTLQQKLAEKQKANQMYENNILKSGGSGGSSGNHSRGSKQDTAEVIILD